MNEDLKAYFAKIGRRGGSVSSEAKKTAARSNGAKPLRFSKAVGEMNPNEVYESLELGDVVRVPTAVLCQILGVTDVHLGKLAAAGHVLKLAQGQYDLWSSIRGYVEFLTKKAESGRKAPQRHTLILAEAKIEESRERRERLAMINAELRRDLVPVQEFVKALGKVATSMRARILSSNLDDSDKAHLMDQLIFLQEGASAHRIQESLP